jgi:hypothetical protein
VIGIVVHFHEYQINTGCYSCGGKRWNVFRLAGGNAIARSWELEAVGYVKYYRETHRPQYWKCPHVDYEIVVAKARSAFGYEDFVMSGR